jgi:hypothetical protein
MGYSVTVSNEAGATKRYDMKTLQELANSFISTDTSAILDDVERLGSIENAADYSADMSAGQPDWEALDSDEGRAALVVAISQLVA